jgi:hypothetical protein
MHISTYRLRLAAGSQLMCVTCASPAVASVSLTMCYHSCRLPRSRVRLFRCATSPAMSLLSLTVVSHSRLTRYIGCAARTVLAAPLRMMCLALPSGMGPGGDEVDFWVFAGVPAGVPRR